MSVKFDHVVDRVGDETDLYPQSRQFNSHLCSINRPTERLFTNLVSLLTEPKFEVNLSENFRLGLKEMGTRQCNNVQLLD